MFHSLIRRLVMQQIVLFLYVQVTITTVEIQKHLVLIIEHKMAFNIVHLQSIVPF